MQKLAFVLVLTLAAAALAVHLAGERPARSAPSGWSALPQQPGASAPQLDRKKPRDGGHSSDEEELSAEGPPSPVEAQR